MGEAKKFVWFPWKFFGEFYQHICLSKKFLIATPLIGISEHNLENVKLEKIEKNWNFYFFLNLFRNNYWGCCNQIFFGKTYMMTKHPEKFAWKTDKFFCPFNLFEVCLNFKTFLENVDFYNTPMHVQNLKIKNRLLGMSSQFA